MSPSLQITIVIFHWIQERSISIGLTPFNFFHRPIIRCERSEFQIFMRNIFILVPFILLLIYLWFFQMKENSFKRGVRSEAKNPHNERKLVVVDREERNDENNN